MSSICNFIVQNGNISSKETNTVSDSFTDDELIKHISNVYMQILLGIPAEDANLSVGKELTIKIISKRIFNSELISQFNKNIGNYPNQTSYKIFFVLETIKHIANYINENNIRNLPLEEILKRMELDNFISNNIKFDNIIYTYKEKLYEIYKEQIDNADKGISNLVTDGVNIFGESYIYVTKINNDYYLNFSTSNVALKFKVDNNSIIIDNNIYILILANRNVPYNSYEKYKFTDFETEEKKYDYINKILLFNIKHIQSNLFYTSPKLIKIKNIDYNIKIPIAFNLTPEQLLAINKLVDFYFNNPKEDISYFILEGYAGTGKTTILDIFHRIVNTYNKFLNKRLSLVFTTPTHTATENLENKLISTKYTKLTTIDSFLNISPNTNRILNNEAFTDSPNTILIIDESSMLNDDIILQLLNKIPILSVTDKEGKINNFYLEGKRKIIFVGDPEQLRPVNNETKSLIFVKDDILLNSFAHVIMTNVVRASGILPEISKTIRDIKPKYLLSSSPITSVIDPDKLKLITYQDNYDNKSGLKVLPFPMISNNITVPSLKPAIDLYKSEEYKKNPYLLRVVSSTNKRVNIINNIIRNVIYGNNYTEPFVEGEIILFNRTHKESELVTLENGKEFIFSKILTKNSGLYKLYNVQKIENYIFSIYGNTVKIPIVYKVYLLDINENTFVKSTINPEKVFPIEFIIIPEEYELLIKNDFSIITKIENINYSIENNVDLDHRLISSRNYLEKHLFLFSITKPKSKEITIKKSISYPYASTVHKSQGNTFTHTFIDEPSISHFLYSAKISAIKKYFDIEDEIIYLEETNEEVTTKKIVSTYKSSNNGILEKTGILQKDIEVNNIRDILKAIVMAIKNNNNSLSEDLYSDLVSRYNAYVKEYFEIKKELYYTAFTRSSLFTYMMTSDKIIKERKNQNESFNNGEIVRYLNKNWIIINKHNDYYTLISPDKSEIVHNVSSNIIYKTERSFPVIEFKGNHYAINKDIIYLLNTDKKIFFNDFFAQDILKQKHRSNLLYVIDNEFYNNFIDYIEKDEKYSSVKIITNINDIYSYHGDIKVISEKLYGKYIKTYTEKDATTNKSKIDIIKENIQQKLVEKIKIEKSIQELNKENNNIENRLSSNVYISQKDNILFIFHKSDSNYFLNPNNVKNISNIIYNAFEIIWNTFFNKEIKDKFISSYEKAINDHGQDNPYFINIFKTELHNSIKLSKSFLTDDIIREKIIPLIKKEIQNPNKEILLNNLIRELNSLEKEITELNESKKIILPFIRFSKEILQNKKYSVKKVNSYKDILDYISTLFDSDQNYYSYNSKLSFINKMSLDVILNRFRELLPNMDFYYVNNENIKWSGLYNGRNGIYFNLANLRADTPWHEIAHPIVNLIEMYNKELYENLKREIINNKIILDSIINDPNYTNLSFEDKIKEAIVKSIGLYSAKLINPKTGHKLINAIKEFLKAASIYLRKLLNLKVINIDELNSNLTLSDISALLVLGKGKIDINRNITKMAKEQQILSFGTNREIIDIFKDELNKNKINMFKFDTKDNVNNNIIVDIVTFYEKNKKRIVKNIPNTKKGINKYSIFRNKKTNELQELKEINNKISAILKTIDNDLIFNYIVNNKESISFTKNNVTYFMDFIIDNKNNPNIINLYNNTKAVIYTINKNDRIYQSPDNYDINIINRFNNILYTLHNNEQEQKDILLDDIKNINNKISYIEYLLYSSNIEDAIFIDYVKNLIFSQGIIDINNSLNIKTNKNYNNIYNNYKNIYSIMYETERLKNYNKIKNILQENDIDENSIYNENKDNIIHSKWLEKALSLILLNKDYSTLLPIEKEYINTESSLEWKKIINNNNYKNIISRYFNENTNTFLDLNDVNYKLNDITIDYINDNNEIRFKNIENYLSANSLNREKLYNISDIELNNYLTYVLSNQIINFETDNNTLYNTSNIIDSFPFSLEIFNYYNQKELTYSNLLLNYLYNTTNAFYLNNDENLSNLEDVIIANKQALQKTFGFTINNIKDILPIIGSSKKMLSELIEYPILYNEIKEFIIYTLNTYPINQLLDINTINETTNTAISFLKNSITKNINHINYILTQLQDSDYRQFYIDNNNLILDVNDISISIDNILNLNTEYYSSKSFSDIFLYASFEYIKTNYNNYDLFLSKEIGNIISILKDKQNVLNYKQELLNYMFNKNKKNNTEQIQNSTIDKLKILDDYLYLLHEKQVENNNIKIIC